MVLKEEEVFVTSGKKKVSVREETNAVSGTRVTIDRAQKPRTQSRHTFWEPAAAVKAGPLGGGECPGTQTKTGLRGTTHPAVVGKVKKGGAKSAWQEEREFEGNEEITAVDPKNLRNRIKPRRWNTVLQETFKCDIEDCGKQHVQFKTTQGLFEWCTMSKGVVDRWEKWDKASGNGTSPSTSGFVQAQ